jgi:two-component sensor histidine kinase
LELKKEINDKHGMAMTLNNLGLTYEVLKNYPKSLSYYIQSLEIKKQIHDDLGTAMTLINIANIYRYNNNYKESFKSLKKALKKAKAIGATTQIRDAYQRYYEIYEALQDYKNALKFHKLFIATKDSMFNESSQKKLAELQEKYEVERKKYEIQKLKHEQEEAKIKIEKNNAVLSSTRTKNYFLIATVVFLALLTLILFKTSKKRKNINEQLNVALKQKDILFKEVHHRVKNNFQLISSILNLHINSIDDEKVTEELREAKNRILSMALVHEKLYKSENLEQIDFKEYLENLIEDLKKSNEVENLQINLNIENLRLNIQQSIHLGLIFNELITNSIKHGFKNLPADYFKKIKITIERISEDKWKATYEDNGLGLPDNFDLTKMDSLGINLIQLLVTQLHGELTFINKPATFVFDFRTEY